MLLDKCTIVSENLRQRNMIRMIKPERLRRNLGLLLFIIFSGTAGYDLLVHEVSWSNTTTRHNR
jgi:hypothetical protein